MIRILTFVFLISAFVIGGFAIFPKSLDSRSEIKIGAILPINNNSEDVLSAKRALELGEGKINASGGIDGRKLSVVFEDGKCDSRKSGEAAKKLIDLGIKIIIAGSCKEETASISGVVKSYGGILVSYAGLDSGITGAGESAYSVTSPDFFEGSFLANYFINDLKINKSALLYDKSAFGQASSDNFRKYFSNSDGEVVLDSAVDFSKDIQEVVSQVKALKPEAVYLAIDSKDNGFEILKKIREEGVNAYFASPISIFDGENISKNPKTFEGSLAISSDIDWKSNLASQNFREEYKASFGDYPSGLAFYAYDSLFIVKDAISANYHGGELNIKNISEWMKSLTNWSGVSGLITMDLGGNGISSKSLKKISKAQVIDVGQYTIDAEKQEGY
ncbi:MAG: ABC transporter substrate-binding protein [Candidatus Pacebacteria bacterium]|nr:ABC transporter substrate-binding protein [Candidatus Paceibacterota bacterium]